jgi:uncharacterized tellurite resistance protein B-like protein
MVSLREIEERVLANGKVETQDIELLRQVLYGDGKIDRRKADVLVELHKRVQRRSPGFEQFFYKAIKDHLVANGRLGAAETAWLRQMLFHDGKIDDEERKFLHQLKGEARETSPEFEALFKECMKQPPLQHTSGG